MILKFKVEHPQTKKSGEAIINQIPNRTKYSETMSVTTIKENTLF